MKTRMDMKMFISSVLSDENSVLLIFFQAVYNEWVVMQESQQGETRPFSFPSLTKDTIILSLRLNVNTNLLYCIYFFLCS